MPKAAQLRVMTFNVRFPSEGDGENRWELRRAGAVAVLREKSPDVLGTQELQDAPAAWLAKNLPEYRCFGASRTGEPGGERPGVFYCRERAALIESGDFWLSETPDAPGTVSWGMDIPRTVAWGLFELAGRRFYLLNTHFPHRPEDAAARVRCAALVAKGIGVLPAGVPAILTGDFNCEPGDPPYKLLTASLQDAWTETNFRRGPSGTYHRFTGMEGPRLDWILYRGALRPVECETVDRSFDGRYPSDHHPVFALFEF